MDKFKAIKRASILGVFFNVVLLIIKAIIGFITNSQAMIADAFNSAGDIFSSVMTFIGNKIASKPRDDDHNLGHGKAEYIFSLFPTKKSNTNNNNFNTPLFFFIFPPNFFSSINIITKKNSNL